MAERPTIPPGSPRNTGFIYFLLADEGIPQPMIKIGFSMRGPDKRLSDCQTGSPVKLKLAAIVVGRMVEEKALHRRFAEHRSHGEWFYFSEEIRAYLEGLDL